MFTLRRIYHSFTAASLMLVCSALSAPAVAQTPATTDAIKQCQRACPSGTDRVAFEACMLRCRELAPAPPPAPAR